MKILGYTIVGFALGLTLSVHACTILEFGAENLLDPRQNTPEIDFQELEAFATGLFQTRPILTGNEPRFEQGLTAPIQLAAFGYAVVHYATGTSGNPAFNRGGSLEFYFIRGGSSCYYTFPQTGPGDSFSNGPVTSVTLFISEPISEAGASVILFAISLSALGMINLVRKGITGFRTDSW